MKGFFNRYGMFSREGKVMNCEKFGMAGLILYSDPREVAPLGTDEEHVYPNTLFLPGDGIQLGSLYPLGQQFTEPLSPGWPSVEHAFRFVPV